MVDATAPVAEVRIEEDGLTCEADIMGAADCCDACCCVGCVTDCCAPRFACDELINVDVDVIEFCDDTHGG